MKKKTGPRYSRLKRKDLFLSDFVDYSAVDICSAKIELFDVIALLYTRRVIWRVLQREISG